MRRAAIALVFIASSAAAEPRVATVEAPEAPAADATTIIAAAPAKPRRWYFRIGGVHIAPLATSREMELADVDGAASLAIQDGPIAGSGATISSATVPGAIVGYVLPWAGRRLAIEAVLGLPFTVHFEATGTIVNESIAPTALGIPTGVGPLGPELGEATAIPIVTSLVFAPLGTERRIVPLVGAGPSILFARDAHVTNPTLVEVGEPDFHISPAPGLVLQGALDVKVYGRIKARIDIKYIAGMLARGTVEHVQVRTPGLPLFDTVEVGTARMAVWVNPLVVQLGVGADF